MGCGVAVTVTCRLNIDDSVLENVFRGCVVRVGDVLSDGEECGARRAAAARSERSSSGNNDEVDALAGSGRNGGIVVEDEKRSGRCALPRCIHRRGRLLSIQLLNARTR